MSEEPKVIFTHRKLILTGDNVAVCQNITTRPKELTVDGITYRASEIVVTGKPYIDFVWLRENDGEWYEDEDTIADGGMTIADAEQVARELLAAVEYAKGMILGSK